MTGNYTLEAEQRCFELADMGRREIFEKLRSIGNDAGTESWVKEFAHIAADYRVSARFALMRRLYADEPDGPEPTAEDAAALTPDELRALEARLLSFAEKKAAERFEPMDGQEKKRCRALVKRALVTGRSGRLIPRDEALELGHRLGFSPEEMQRFLLRSLDYEDGFRWNRSEDLVHVFGFLNDSGPGAVAELKAEYDSRAAHIPKSGLEGKKADWTRDVSKSLPEEYAHWPFGKKEESFLGWLLEKAPLLDLPSLSALTVFRNLAVAAARPVMLDWDGGEDIVTLATELSYGAKETELTRSTLYKNGVISPQMCGEVADAILNSNRDAAEGTHPFIAANYHVVATKSNGEPSIAAGVNAEHDRIERLLLGEGTVQKCDVLYLVWQLANFCWLGLERETVSDRLRSFIDAAEICLDNAMLPPLYIPHLMEQSMLLAVVYSGERGDPAVVYEKLCQAAARVGIADIEGVRA